MPKLFLVHFPIHSIGIASRAPLWDLNLIWRKGFAPIIRTTALLEREREVRGRAGKMGEGFGNSSPLEPFRIGATLALNHRPIDCRMAFRANHLHYFYYTSKADIAARRWTPFVSGIVLLFGLQIISSVQSTRMGRHIRVLKNDSYLFRKKNCSFPIPPNIQEYFNYVGETF